MARSREPTKPRDLDEPGPHLGPPHPGCAVCSRNLPFEMPPELVQAVADRRVVIFAGAGISTEDKLVTRLSIYDDLRGDVDLPDGTPFPRVMSTFVEKYGRAELLQYILKRFDIIRAMPEAEKLASRFHTELAPVPQINQIYTTNWDTYFERYMQAVPFVTDADFAFWEVPRRKVFKLHGSIENVSTIVATTGDYTRRLRELSRGLLGATLRLALATKTVLFVGYSLRDTDFQQVYRYLARQMGDVLPRSYIVTLSDRPAPAFVSSSQIRTDATYFIAQLKLALVRSGHMLTENRVPAAYVLRRRVAKVDDDIHKINLQRYPSAIYATSYLNGLAHSLDRAQSEWNTGKYHDREYLDNLAHGYLRHWRRGAVKARRYEDVAYIEGFGVGLIFLLGELPVDAVPLLYLAESGPTLAAKQFGAGLPRTEKRHPGAHRRALRIVRRLPPGTVWHHTTELLGVHPI